jgi:hypothetical protein
MTEPQTTCMYQIALQLSYLRTLRARWLFSKLTTYVDVGVDVDVGVVVDVNINVDVGHLDTNGFFSRS